VACSLTLLIAVSAALLAGCGSSGNGIASKSPAQILAAAKVAAEGASSVRVESKLAQGGFVSTIDADLISSHGGRGQFSLGPIMAELILIDNILYIKGSRALFGQSARAAPLPKGTWLKGTASSVGLAVYASLVSQQKLLGRLLASTGALTKGRTTTVAGEKVVELKETGRKLFAASLYIAATGKPYPIEIVKRGAESGQIIFSHWNEPFSLSAPANAIDVSQLRHVGH
jgi:hypothetical protein